MLTVKNKGRCNGFFKGDPLPELFRQDEINLSLGWMHILNGTCKPFPASVFLILELMLSPPVTCNDDPAHKEAFYRLLVFPLGSQPSSLSGIVSVTAFKFPIAVKND